MSRVKKRRSTKKSSQSKELSTRKSTKKRSSTVPSDVPTPKLKDIPSANGSLNQPLSSPDGKSSKTTEDKPSPKSSRKLSKRARPGPSPKSTGKADKTTEENPSSEALKSRKAKSSPASKAKGPKTPEKKPSSKSDISPTSMDDVPLALLTPGTTPQKGKKKRRRSLGKTPESKPSPKSGVLPVSVDDIPLASLIPAPAPQKSKMTSEKDLPKTSESKPSLMSDDMSKKSVDDIPLSFLTPSAVPHENKKWKKILSKQPRKRARTSMTESVAVETPPSPTTVTAPQSSEECPLTIHETSFIVPHVTGICAVATPLSGNVVAAARSDGSIELRDISLQWATTARVFPDSIGAKGVVKSMAFTPCGAYLLAARLDGRLCIYQCTSQGLLPHVTLHPGDGALWNVTCAEPKKGVFFLFAVACDDGCVRFIRPDPNLTDVSKDQELPTDPAHYLISSSEISNGRALSLAWAPSALTSDDARVIACGDSKGTVRWINSDSGKCVGRGKIPSLQQIHIMIWTMQFIRNGQFLLCGDDRGMITIWSTATNTLVDELRVEGLVGTLWCSTVVSRDKASEIVLFGSACGTAGGVRTGISFDGRWPLLRAFECHKHDIRGMACLSSGEFITGSRDSRIGLIRREDLHSKLGCVEAKMIYEEDGVLRQPSVQVIRKHRLLLHRSAHSVDLWSSEYESVKLLLRMSLKSVRSDLIACALSDDASLLVVSAPGVFKLYHIWDNGGGKPLTSPSFGKVDLLEVDCKVEDLLHGCVDVIFCKDTLIALSRCRTKIISFNVPVGELSVIPSSVMGCTAKILCSLASGSDVIAVSDSRGSVHIGTISRECNGETNWSWSSLRKDEGEKAICAMGLSANGEKLAFCTVDGNVFVSDLKDEVNVISNIGTFPSVANALSISENSQSLLLSGSGHCRIMACDVSGAVKKRRRGEDYSHSKGLSLRVKKSILCTGILGPGEIVFIRRNWNTIEESLPSVVPRKPRKI